MTSTLLISVRLHDGRYHGAGDWPPAPARLFQALVAGAGLSGPLAREDAEALGWLEKRPNAPLIGAPVMRVGQRVMFYMPNNDLDAVGGDPRRIAEIRTATKFFQPFLFDATVPFLYAWPLDPSEEQEPHVRVICALSERLYQLGRGIDMAWAWGEVLDAPQLEARLSSYPGRICRPSRGGGIILACPQPHSLVSLRTRYEANTRRFKVESKGETVVSWAPVPGFQLVAYESPPSRRVYDLRDRSGQALFAPWPLVRAHKLAVLLRDRAVNRLRRALPAQQEEIERVIVGRKSDGTNHGTSKRVRIVPLPSIGHPHADRAIRRVLVEVPASCPLRADDVHWAFSGLDLGHEGSDEGGGVTLIPAAEDGMLAGHYGVGEHAHFCVWRTVTAAALPEAAARRRIEPTRRVAEAKDGRERVLEQAKAASAVTQALRHAEVGARAEAIRVQREPFERYGERAEGFAQGTRFPKERLWHVEVTFATPLSGPLVIGDGRFLGLGLMAPLSRLPGVHAFVIENGLASKPEPMEVVRALRRAVMARVQQVLGDRATLPTYFSGHERDGSPARSQHSSHLAFVFDPASQRLLLIAPHVLDRRAPETEEKKQLGILETALADFRELRAGAVGRLTLRTTPVDADTDPLLTASRTWESAVPYQVSRHTKQVGAGEALAIDLRAECRRRGLPEPLVASLEMHGVPGVGLMGRARLTFKVAVEGPIILGRSRYTGGGLFVSMGDARALVASVSQA